jgi:hypothetical protein
MDDFIYGEPQAVPEPAAMGVTLLLLAACGRRVRL